MPEPLSQMGNLSMMTPQNIQNIPRFSNPPPDTYQNFTLIEDIFAMPHYNSNPIIPAYPYRLPVPLSTPQPPLQGVPQNIYLPYTHPPVQTIVNDFNQQHPLTDHRNQYPPYAGAVPYLEHAQKMDKTVPLREGFSDLTLSTQNYKVIIFILCLIILYLLFTRTTESKATPIKFYY